MDPTRFDRLTRLLATRPSRRTLLRGLGGGLAGALLPGLGVRPTLAAKGGNSACAHFCAATFGADTPAADQCTSDAAHGQGLCYECGPKGSSGGVLCNGTCCPAACECLSSVGGVACTDQAAVSPGSCTDFPGGVCPAGSTCLDGLACFPLCAA